MELLAVHLPDGFLPTSWLAVGWAVAGLLVAAGLTSVSEDQLPRIGLLTAALFVASQVHVPIGVGKVHLLLNAVAGILLGRFVGVSVAVALTFQFFLFAHGGLTTLGLNVAVIGLPALGGYGLFGLLRRKLMRWAFAVGASLGLLVSSATVALNALVVWFGMEDGGQAAAITVLIVHLPIIAVESAITGTLLSYLSRVKPEWLGVTRPAA